MRACQTNPSYSSATLDILHRGEVVSLVGFDVMSFRVDAYIFCHIF